MLLERVRVPMIAFQKRAVSMVWDGVVPGTASHVATQADGATGK